MSSEPARSPRPEVSRDSQADQSPETTQSPDARQNSEAACFSVHARAEPGIMPRVMELFAKRGLVPSSWHSATSFPLENGRESELTIDIQMRGMPAETADFIAARLRQIADVEVVLTSRKR